MVKLWTPAPVSAQDESLARELDREFSTAELKILERYHQFCDVNLIDDRPTFSSVALMASQMLNCGTRHSYAALYVRTVKKLARRAGIYDLPRRLETLASRLELRGRAEPPSLPAEVTSDELERLRASHPDPAVRLMTELMMRTTFRVGDVQAVSGVHVQENLVGFLITLFGGKNHRKAIRIGKVTLHREELSPAMIRYLHRLRTRPSAPFTVLSTAVFNRKVSAYLGRRVTSRSIRNFAIERVLISAQDPVTGAVDYPKAALRTLHHNWRTLQSSYHKRALARRA